MVNPGETKYSNAGPLRGCKLRTGGMVIENLQNRRTLEGTKVRYKCTRLPVPTSKPSDEGKEWRERRGRSMELIKDKIVAQSPQFRFCGQIDWSERTMRNRKKRVMEKPAKKEKAQIKSEREKKQEEEKKR